MSSPVAHGSHLFTDINTPTAPATALEGGNLRPESCRIQVKVARGSADAGLQIHERGPGSTQATPTTGH